MRAGIDAYAQGHKMGLSRDKIVSYGMSEEMTHSVFRVAAVNTVAYASGVKADLGYTSLQKKESGDCRKVFCRLI